MKLAIFASGKGSNAKAILDYFQDDDEHQVKLIVSNRKAAGVFDIAKEYSVDEQYIAKNDWEDEPLVMSHLKDVDFIVLAGFLLKIPAYLIQHFNEKIINIHPALLPNFGGKGMYGMNVHQAVKDQGETESGITIHLVDEVYDNGRHLHQAKVALDGTETVQEIAAKVLKLEHYHFPRVIASYISTNK